MRAMNSRLRASLDVVLPPLVFLLLVLVAWDRLVAWFSIPQYTMPRPIVVVQAARQHAATLGMAVALTGGAALAGFAVSLCLGTLVAFVFSQSRWIRRSVYPYAIFLQTVPIVAIAPLVIAWFDYGFHSVVIVATTISLFPIITSVTAGLSAVDPNLGELFQMHNATGLQTLLKLRLPHAVPYLVAGAKTSCGLSVIGAIVGEMFAGHGSGVSGLGALITKTHGLLQTDYLYAAVIASTLLGICIFTLVSLLGNIILARWHFPTKKPAGV